MAKDVTRCGLFISATTSCQPTAEMVKIAATISCKESSHKVLYDLMAGDEWERHEERHRKGRPKREGVPLRDGKDATPDRL